MSTRTKILILILHLLFLMKIAEPIHLFRMPPRMVGRTVKCCNPNSGNQTIVSLKLKDAPIEFRRDMTEFYHSNRQGTAFQSEPEALVENMNDMPPAPLEELEDHIVSPEEQKALTCAKLPCQKEDHDGLVCACNFKSGRVVSFKNECDLRKHNCRFDTDFRIILNDVCPWQYESRHESDIFDYSNPSYYN